MLINYNPKPGVARKGMYTPRYNFQDNKPPSEKESEKAEYARAKAAAENGEEWGKKVVEYFDNGKKRPKKVWTARLKGTILKLNNAGYSNKNVTEMMGEMLKETTINSITHGRPIITEDTAREAYNHLEKILTAKEKEHLLCQK